MAPRLSFAFLFYCSLLLLVGCKERTSMLGTWHREWEGSTAPGINVNSGWGDITFNDDSTFYIQGDTLAKDVVDTVPGWHAGGYMKGRWQLEGDVVLFYYEDLFPKFPLRYQLIELNKNRLVLLSPGTFGDSSSYMKYWRIK